MPKTAQSAAAARQEVRRTSGVDGASLRAAGAPVRAFVPDGLRQAADCARLRRAARLPASCVPPPEPAFPPPTNVWKKKRFNFKKIH